MLDIKYRFTCGDWDPREIIKKCQNIMTRIVDEAINYHMFQLFHSERMAPVLPFLSEISRFEIILA